MKFKFSRMGIILISLLFITIIGYFIFMIDKYQKVEFSYHKHCRSNMLTFKRSTELYLMEYNFENNYKSIKLSKKFLQREGMLSHEVGTCQCKSGKYTITVLNDPKKQ